MPAGEKHRDEVFTDLVTEHQARLYGYIFAMVQNSADTEDLVQRTLITLWRRFDQFELGTDFCAWSLTTARYEVLNFQRAGRRPNLFTEELLNRLAERAAATTSAEQDSARRVALHACVEGLSPADQRLIDLRYSQDQKLREMADQLDRSEQSLSNSLSRIRGGLFDCVRRHLAREENS